MLRSDPTWQSQATVQEPGATGLDQIMELTTGLWASQTLVAAESLDLFTLVSERGGATTEEVATDLGIEERPADVLLTACAGLGLLTREGGRYRNAPAAEQYLVRGRETFFGDYVRMLRDFVNPGWMKITDAVLSNSPSRWAELEEKDDNFGSKARPAYFWTGLFPLSTATASALATSVDLSQSRRLLDVGGGGGAFAIELARRNPGLDVTIYDLPHVCDLTAERVTAAELDDRISLHRGDFFVDEQLPLDHDTVLLSMILHDWDEPRNRELLRKCFDALPNGGTVVVSELLVDDDKTGPRDAALMSMTMLTGTWGRNYTAAEYGLWLRDVGFDDVRTIRFRAPAANGALVASKR